MTIFTTICRSLMMGYRRLHNLAPKNAFFKDGIFYDNRKPGEREIINCAWIPKNGKGSLRIERIDEKDFELIGSFFNYHFSKYGNLWTGIDAKYEDTEQMILDGLLIAIKKPTSYAAFDGNQLVGFHINRIHTPDEFPQLFEGKRFDPNAKF
uniref:Uncharacterized protein n=1 Tax=Panagrolaimus davidi TaxID=227884 RepID=A0A914QA77_9BILA